MLTSAIVRIIDFCVRHARLVVAVFLLAGVGSGLYAARHFKINSDISALLSEKLPWRQREAVFERAFHRFQMLVVVVEAPTPELTSQATAELTRRLAGDKQHFVEVTNIGGLPFFAREGLMFLPLEDLRRTIGGLAQGAPLLQDFTGDMSLRGLVAGLEDGLIGVNSGKLKLDGMSGILNASSDTVEAVLAGRPAAFSWRVASAGHPATPGELRGVIEVRPVLDYHEVQAGLASSDALRKIAADIAPRYQARVRLTGPVAMSDEEFGTIKENATRNGIITGAIVLLILWRALRTWRLIAAVTINLMVGLALTAALGLAMVGAFNLISVYFMVLFVGIGVDFGIQLSVRYRAERHEIDDLATAISRAGFHFGAPLTLAGLATAAGFLSFLPTDYKGVSELGLIAGVGMLIAYVASVTFLPALIFMFNPPGEPEAMGYKALAPLDDYMARHRVGNHRRHGHCRHLRPAVVLLAEIRLQPDRPARSQDRGGGDLPGTGPRSGRGGQRHPGSRSHARSGQGGRGKARQAAGSVACADDHELCPRSAGRKTRADQGCRRKARARAEPEGCSGAA